LEGTNDVGNARKDLVGRVGGWHVDVGGEPCGGVADVGRPCFGYPNGVAMVRVPCGAKVPSFKTVGGPAATCIVFDRGQDVGAQWGNGYAVEIKCVMDVSPGGEAMGCIGSHR